MRLFIGIPLSPAACEDTAALARKAQRVIPGRYALESNYHLTLAFIGEVPPERLEETKAVLRAFAGKFVALEIALGGMSHFGKEKNAILIRTAQSKSDLYAMHDALCGLLLGRGLPHTDGPFAPHVTLARHADVTGAACEAVCAEDTLFTAREAVLFLSARDGENVLRYTPLAVARFAER